MRILLLGHYEIASNLGLSLIADALKAHELRIMLSAQPSPKADTPAALVELARYESQLCEVLDAKARRQGPYGFQALAKRTGHPVAILKNPNSDQGHAAISRFKPDLIVSCRYRRILRDEAIALARFGVINLHSGLLPQYRGVMATFWAMLAQEKEIGATLHYIADSSIDTGAVIAQRSIALQANASYLHNVLRLYPASQHLVAQAVQQIEATGKATSMPQQDAGSYFSAPQSSDLARFEQKGLILFDGAELDAVIS
ncbi:MAG: formyl transferase [Myxococcales bacterium]|nr:MAG: formyl transferase [Myxococcales bacterium]